MIRAVYIQPLTFAQTAGRAHTLRVLTVRRVIFWQGAAVVVAIALAVTLSRFFPVVSFVEALQERVMSWGAWAGVCYPLLFAACNILLLAGRRPCCGGRFLLRTMVGIFDRVCRQHRFDGDFVFAESLRREAMVSAKALS